VPNDNVDDSKVVEDVYVSPEAILTLQWLSPVLPTLDEVHKFSEGTNDDVDVRVESSTPILTDVHAHNNDTDDSGREPRVESTMTTLNYLLSNQSLEFLSMIHQVVFGFSSFSKCLEMFPESSIPL